LRGAERLGQRRQHREAVLLAQALDLVEQRMVPADQLHGSAKAQLAQRADDLDRIGALERKVEKEDIRWRLAAGLQHLAGSADPLELEPATRDGELEHAPDRRL